MTAWLPAIRLARRRHWLPLSVPTGDALAACLINQTAGDASVTSLLTDCLVRDPAFFFLTLHHWQRSFATTPIDSQPIRISYLAAFASANWCQWFQSGDGQLGTPTINDALVHSWQSLYHETIAEPLERWPALSTRWLELTGPVVTTRQLELALVVDEVDEHAQLDLARYALPETYGQFQLNLAQLVRLTRRHQRLTNRFVEQLEQQKQAAVKQFAYGLSHELNNPLANISVRAQGLMRSETSDERKQSLSRIIEQTSRAHDMLADLMFFAHPPQPVMRDVLVSEVIDEVIQQYAAQATQADIELRMSTAHDERLQVDPAMLAEAISVLIRNSIEAIGVQGRIDINLERIAHGKRTLVEIRVADSGPGLSPQATQHAFDPYFSGREAGRGLGVGLCRAWRIAALHGGTVSLQPAPVGCIATLRLPQT